MTVRFQVPDSTDPTGDTASAFRDVLLGLLSVPVGDAPPDKRPALSASGKRGIVWVTGNQEFDIVVSGPYRKRKKAAAEQFERCGKIDLNDARRYCGLLPNHDGDCYTLKGTKLAT